MDWGVAQDTTAENELAVVGTPGSSAVAEQARRVWTRGRHLCARAMLATLWRAGAGGAEGDCRKARDPDANRRYHDCGAKRRPPRFRTRIGRAYRESIGERVSAVSPVRAALFLSCLYRHAIRAPSCAELGSQGPRPYTSRVAM